jgi:hypothetical protein
MRTLIEQRELIAISDEVLEHVEQEMSDLVGRLSPRSFHGNEMQRHSRQRYGLQRLRMPCWLLATRSPGSIPADEDDAGVCHTKSISVPTRHG